MPELISESSVRAFNADGENSPSVPVAIAAGTFFSSTQQGELNIRVILVGDPWTGFTVVGPLGEHDDADLVGEWARNDYGGSDYYVVELQGPGDEKRYCDGDIGLPFKFQGPFKTLEAAETWASHANGIAMESAEPSAFAPVCAASPP